MFVLGFQSFVI